ncbi:hypothetical protein [Spirulina sp. 06S082]|uniref:slr1601 family putative cell division protein n=1 Tax=Spirulina sp. 06S082 TaxID=3110248 RepID=UPI002B1F3FD5|nr:hypothetical protein [Spirulina sp. 06S082]MEA5471370.1 hypothetical protein [Spirulina sp. 06S082]
MKAAKKFNNISPNPPKSSSQPSRAYRSRPKSKHNTHIARATETILKLAINGGLSAVAIATLTNLFPYYWGQRAKVQAVRMEVREAEYKVTRLRANLNRSFDPSQALNVMQEQSAMLAPNQRRIVLMDEAENR